MILHGLDFTIYKNNNKATYCGKQIRQIIIYLFMTTIAFIIMSIYPIISILIFLVILTTILFI